MSFLDILFVFSAPLFLWHAAIGCIYVGFFPCSIVDGKYFSYKPDEFEKIFHVERAYIFWRNCFKYLLGIERPEMPLYLKIFVTFSAISHLGWWYFIVSGVFD